MEYGLLIATEPLFWIFRVWKIRSFLSQKIGGNMIFTDYWNVLALNFSGGGKYSLSLRQKFNGNMIFTDYWKVLVLKFSGMGNTVFFEAKGSWKNGIYWLLKSSCFELFGDGKDGLFLRQKVNGKMIFPDYWKVLVLGYRKVLVLNFSLMGNIYLVFFSFPWSEKYGFSCSVFTDIITDNIFPTKDYTYS